MDEPGGGFECAGRLNESPSEKEGKSLPNVGAVRVTKPQ